MFFYKPVSLIQSLPIICKILFMTFKWPFNILSLMFPIHLLKQTENSVCSRRDPSFHSSFIFIYRFCLFYISVPKLPRILLPCPMKNWKPTSKTVQNLHKCFHSPATCKLHGHRACGRRQSPRVTSWSKRTQRQIHLRKP